MGFWTLGMAIDVERNNTETESTQLGTVEPER